jgi:hypothetical protein
MFELAKKLPVWLIAVLLLVTAILLSYAVFDGRDVNFWPPSITGKQSLDVIKGKDKKISELKEELAQDKAYSSRELGKYKKKFKKQNIKLANEIEELEKKINEYNGLSEDFLFLLLKFTRDARCYGTSLNFTAGERRLKCTSKKDLAIRFLGFLEELDLYDKDEPKTPKIAKKELIKFQEKHGVKNSGWYNIHVFKMMVSEFHGRA